MAGGVPCAVGALGQREQRDFQLVTGWGPDPSLPSTLTFTAGSVQRDRDPGGTSDGQGVVVANRGDKKATSTQAGTDIVDGFIEVGFGEQVRQCVVTGDDCIEVAHDHFAHRAYICDLQVDLQAASTSFHTRALDRALTEIRTRDVIAEDGQRQCLGADPTRTVQDPGVFAYTASGQKARDDPAMPHRCPPPVLEQDVVLRSETVVKLLWARHVTHCLSSQPGHWNGHRRRPTTVPSSDARTARASADSTAPVSAHVVKDSTRDDLGVVRRKASVSGWLR